MRLRSARGLVAAIALSLPACAAPPAPGPAPAAVSTARSTEVIRREGNHLVGEASPYLEQHAHNPVDWYTWSEAATARAKQEGKLVFLSIGYSTCHWCHVMERESFEDDETARYLNDHFIAIKVDREQRPDLDALFLAAVARIGGSTGWPLTVVLTPDLEPDGTASRSLRSRRARSGSTRRACSRPQRSRRASSSSAAGSRTIAP